MIIFSFTRTYIVITVSIKWNGIFSNFRLFVFVWQSIIVLFCFHVSNTYRCSVFICLDKMSLNVSISLIFSLRPPLPEVWLNKIEFDCNDIVLPWRINAVISMPTGTLYDCNTSTQCVLSSGVSARKYQTQLFTDTSKRHSSNSWLWKKKQQKGYRQWVSFIPARFTLLLIYPNGTYFYRGFIQTDDTSTSIITLEFTVQKNRK